MERRYLQNNNLIEAIAAALGVPVEAETMREIRDQLKEETGQPPGENLDPSKGDTLGIILGHLGIRRIPILIISDDSARSLFTPSGEGWTVQTAVMDGSPGSAAIPENTIPIHYLTPAKYFFFEHPALKPT